MSFRIKILLLAVIPLLLLTGVIAWVGFQIEREFSAEQELILEGGLRASKAKELESHVRLALSAIGPTLSDPTLTDEAAQEQTKRIINDLRYGQDGYFFLYDDHGINLVHPIQKHLVGKNLFGKQDSEGRFVIRELLEVAQRGGGIVRYRWDRPSTRREEEKVGYVLLVPRWGWMLGSGLYDVSADVQNSLRQLQDNVHSTFRNIIAVLTVTIFAIIILVSFINLHEGRLADRNLRILAHKFVQLQVEERRLFSRNLHENVNQLLAAAKYQIALALMQVNKGDEGFRENINRSLTTLDKAIGQVRSISHALRPDLLDQLGLGPALAHLLAQFQERTGIVTKLDTELRDEGIADDAGITLYRVVEEALTNVEKHAGAHQVVLRLEQTASDVRLELSDDGHGFEPTELTPRRGIGLETMRERVELLEGQFRVESNPGRGTHIYATLPLKLFGRR